MNVPTEWLAVRAFVLVRASHICEGCGASRADEVHHRQPRGMGGVSGAAEARANNPANLLALCLACHRFTEEEPAQARGRGWVVPHPTSSPLIPAKIVPIYGAGWYHLLGDLSYLPCEEWKAQKILRNYGLSGPS